MFLEFLDADIELLSANTDGYTFAEVREYNKALEFSRSLIIQLLIKCASEH